MTISPETAGSTFLDKTLLAIRSNNLEHQKSGYPLAWDLIIH